jgi:hypothetical protein
MKPVAAGLWRDAEAEGRIEAARARAKARAAAPLRADIVRSACAALIGGGHGMLARDLAEACGVDLAAEKETGILGGIAVPARRGSR